VEGLEGSSRVLVVLPNWVGDVVMATPALAALRSGLARAHITSVVKPKLAELLDAQGLFDDVIPRGSGYTLREAFSLARRIRHGRFDAAVLFTNSFGSALTARMAGIHRIAGYRRDMRSFLLTDGIDAPREGGRFLPEPMTRYYLRLVRSLGIEAPDVPVELTATDAERAHARRLLANADVDPDRPFVVLIPGASFGPSKMWPTPYYARLARMIVDARLAQCLAVLAPDEERLGRELASAGPVKALVTGLGELKGIISFALAVVTNDTGPRHIAAALGTPVVTIIGPTDPRWSQVGYKHEVILARPPECAPCMKPVCRHDHECMTAIKSDEVFEALRGVLAACKSDRVVYGTGDFRLSCSRAGDGAFIARSGENASTWSNC